MIKFTLFVVLYCVGISFIYAQTNIERIKHDVYILASDSFEGRKPYTKGDTLATQYILNEFLKNKVELLAKNGKQEFSFKHSREIINTDLKIDDISYQYRRDFVPAIYSQNKILETTAVYAGYGLIFNEDTIKINHYYHCDVSNKWVIMLTRKPENINMPRNMYSDMIKASIKKKKNAAGVIFIAGNSLPEQDYNTLNNANIPVMYITSEVFNELCNQNQLNADSLIQKAATTNIFEPIELKNKISATINIEIKNGYTNNIIGITRGSDPILKSEFIVIGAHFDHLGISPSRKNGNSFTPEIHNGADDNASGVSAMLELMRLIQSSDVKPKRSIVWVAFAAEEKGLLGSKYFTENPPVELNKIVAMINLDMIGRLDEDNPKLTISGTGTSKIFKKLIEKHSANLPFKIAQVPSGEGPSDHANFYRKRIPVLFLNSGLHLDYHQPTDDADKINYQGMAQIINFAYNLLIDLANTNKAPKFKETKIKEKTKSSHNESKITLGIIPDVTGSTDGLLVEGVREGGLASKNGIKKGDIIVDINGKSVKNIYDYMDRLNELEKQKEIKVKLKRNNEIKEILIRLQ